MLCNPKDSTLRQVLEETATIAMVGASTNPVSPSLFVATYFSGRGRAGDSDQSDPGRRDPARRAGIGEHSRHSPECQD